MDKISSDIKLVECPRDAMQGWPVFIPTEKKAAYINSLLQAGFDTIDFGSFVSPKAIPQMADTKEVISQLHLTNTNTKLLAIVANERGAIEASQFDEISFLGFPFSVSETFQLKNTNSSITESIKRVDAIQKICLATNKKLAIYISMAFGNPYGDRWNEEIVYLQVHELVKMGVEIISLADTVGLANAQQVGKMTSFLIKQLPETEIGVHLHSTPHNWKEKLEAAFSAGCKRFDGALKGIGGCPMAGNELVGNMDTEKLISFFKTSLQINHEALQKSLVLADEIFSK